MNIGEPRFDEPGAQNANFCVGFSLERELANRLRPQTCIQRTTNIRQRQLPELFFDPRRSERAKTQACPARRPISLASAYLVRVAGTPVELRAVPYFL